MSLFDTEEEAIPDVLDLRMASPEAIVENEVLNRRGVSKSIESFRKHYCFFNQALLAVKEVTNYVPHNAPPLWKDQIIPALVQALTDDVKARNVVTKALSSIQTFSTTVHQSGTQVMQAKGSAQSVRIAQKLIPLQLQRIEEAIEMVETVESTAILVLRQHYNAILKIAGPKAADFSAQEAEVYSRMDQLLKTKAEMAEQESKNNAQVEKFFHLIGASERALNVSKDRANEETARRQELSQLISSTEARRQAVPATISQTTHTNHSSGRWFWKRRWTTTTTTQVRNPNLQHDQNYYESIIASRNTRLAGIDASEEQKRNAVQQQEKDLASYRAQYKEAVTRAKDFVQSSAPRLKSLNDGIDECIREIKDIREKAESMENEFGLRGSVLLDCLASIREMSDSCHSAATLFAPLAAVLRSVHSSAEANVMLLSGDKNDVYVAGKALLAQCRHYNSSFIELQSAMSEYPSARIEQ